MKAISISEIAAGISIISVLLIGTIGFNVQSALAEHDSGQDSHPKILAQIQLTNARLEVLTVKLEQNTKVAELVQAQNSVDHERMLTTLDRIADKVNTL